MDARFREHDDNETAPINRSLTWIRSPGDHQQSIDFVQEVGAQISVCRLWAERGRHLWRNHLLKVPSAAAGRIGA